MDVVVVGSYNQDLVFSVPRFPRPGETALGQFASGSGGKGSNQAIAAARAGARTGLVVGLGRDAPAEAAMELFRLEGVEAQPVRFDDAPTGAAAIMVDGEGQNSIIVALGANQRLRLADLDFDFMARAKVALFQFESDLALVEGALARARQLGLKTVLNPAPMRIEMPLEMLASVDFLIPNAGEFCLLLDRIDSKSGPLEEEALASLSADDLHEHCRLLGPAAVIVTLGERGCFVSLEEGFREIPAYQVTPCDTTGAGDAFVGAFAAALARFDGDALEAAEFANAAAAVKVTRRGAAAGMPRLAEIEAMRAKRA
jgi:ribokinase